MLGSQLKARSQYCEFRDLIESFIRDKIALGVQDKKVQERLLRETNLSLDKAISICRAAEGVKIHAKEMQSNKTDMASKVELVLKA